jgi:hypothetical protein
MIQVKAFVDIVASILRRTSIIIATDSDIVSRLPRGKYMVTVVTIVALVASARKHKHWGTIAVVVFDREENDYVFQQFGDTRHIRPSLGWWASHKYENVTWND